MKILVLALSGIGDALMFTPALTLLRKARPNAQIDALVMFKGVKDIYINNPDLDKIFYYNFLDKGFFKSLKFILSLRKKYNTTINVYPSNRREYNVINILLGAEKRVAVNYLRANILNFGWLNNTTIKENDSLHNVMENIKLVEKIVKREFSEEPKLKIFLTEKDVAFAKDLMSQESISESDLIIGIHPGCATLKNHIKRRWEPEKFAKLARSLIQNKSAKVLIFGGPDEDGLKENIKKLIDSPRAIVVKTPDLIKTAAIMKRCNVFVTNDSSLMHISAALGLNVVTIIGPTNSNYIKPWKTEHKIVSLNLECSPCFYYSPKPLSCSRTDIKFKCIKELDVDMVYNKVESFI
jgi:heptosyltransferase-2